MYTGETEPQLHDNEVLAPYQILIGYDARENTYALFAHNIPTADAQTELMRLRALNLPIYTLDQPRVHRAADPETCLACYHIVYQFFAVHAPSPKN
jgi:hypothetical protein